MLDPAIQNFLSERKATRIKEKLKKCETDEKKHQVEIDDREKYDEKIRLAALAMFQEGLSLRAVARLLNDIFGLNVSYQLIQKWFYVMYKKLQKKLEKIPKESRQIDILEMDELYTFIKKKSIKSEFGLLLIGTHCVLLRLKSARER